MARLFNKKWFQIHHNFFGNITNFIHKLINNFKSTSINFIYNSFRANCGPRLSFFLAFFVFVAALLPKLS